MTPTPDTARFPTLLPPTDDAPTGNGLSPDAQSNPSNRILLIACGALAREVLDLRAQEGLAHLDLVCLPAGLHNRPERIPGAVRAAVAQHGAGYGAIKLLYADCGTGGRLAALCDELGIEMLPGPHCYALYDGLARFAARGEITSFYLTDFLVRQFDAFVWRPLGLDRHPELRDTYFGNYRMLVHLAQVEDPETAIQAEHCATRLGLGFERRRTGYGELGTTLAGWAQSET